MTTFSTKAILKARLHLLMLPWQQHTRQLNYQKTKVCVVNLLVTIFGDRGIKDLEKKVNETQVSKTVLSHLKQLTFIWLPAAKIPEKIVSYAL